MMNIKDEKAVSPVIGVILMVVITVIIAAILAVFAFGMGAPNKAPQTQLKFTAPGAGSMTILNAGGDTLLLKDTRISITNADTAAVILASTSLGTTGSLAPGATMTVPGLTVPATGTIMLVKVLDVPTGQLISDAKVIAT